MPMTALPGIGATIRMLMARRAKARSSVKLTNFIDFDPGGRPVFKSRNHRARGYGHHFPGTPKSSSFFSRRRDCIFRFSLSTEAGLTSGSSSRLTRQRKPLAGVHKVKKLLLGRFFLIFRWHDFRLHDLRPFSPLLGP